ncbi:MAG TPA: DNA polymerase/3'-5' exonuclease PolX [Gemmatimonadaceae bacterium]|nr:DNA polymerase/3'-5' exonuclease PolX [Gemmatimonadaceae bacterium]
MDARTAAHTLAQIAAYLELRGENRFKTGAYERAARAVQGLGADDLAPLLKSGALAATAGIGPATLSVIEDLIRTGESSYLERLRAEMPEGLLELLRLPGLGIAKIRKIHEALGVTSVAELEAAARDGRIAKLPRFSAKTAQGILAAIERARAAGTRRRYADARVEAESLLSWVSSHPEVARAELAGSLRRHLEIVADVDVVAACRASAAPADVARDFASGPGVTQADGVGTASVRVAFVDGTVLHVHCTTASEYAPALWRATGPDTHVDAMRERLAARGIRVEGDTMLDPHGRRVAVADEEAIYRLAAMAWIPPELRDDLDALDVAEGDALPRLLTGSDIRGVLHSHTTWSDGKASVRQMADAARERGWSYIGISDHSQAAFYAGGLSPDQVLEQHAEIDAVNATLASSGFVVLKGIEADILPDGQLDYDPALLARFDYVIGSVHSRFKMNEREMTDRVLAALDSPWLTILGHPTGRLLLSREPYAIDVDAVLERAAANGVAVEINADPHRLDLDWRYVRGALARGVTIEIGPDAHSPRGLDYTAYGVGMARKGWVTADDVLNARSVEEVSSFARKRRER